MNDSELIGNLSNIYIMLLCSIMKNDIERVKCYLNDNLYNKYKEIIDNHIDKNETEMYDELNVHKIDIISRNIVDNKEVITVRLESRYMNYIMDNETKKVTSGVNTHRIEKTNILVFEKDNNTNNNKVVHKCPNCGANLDINYNGVCSYCNKSINLKEDYVLTKLDTIN